MQASRKFLELRKDSLLKVLDGSSVGGALLGSVLVDKEVLIEDVRVNKSLSCGYHERMP